MESNKERFDKARILKDYIRNIRATYTRDFTSEDEVKKQKAVATYMIDKLALNAGIEKDDDDEVSLLGCCTIKVENIKANPPNMLEFSFHGKGLTVETVYEVEDSVWEAIVQFQAGKQGSDVLFDKLDTYELTVHLKELMPGLKANLLRTYNASVSLDNILNKETMEGDDFKKNLFYYHACTEVASIIHNNPRSRTIFNPDNPSLLHLGGLIGDLQGTLADLEMDLDRAKKGKRLKVAEGEEEGNLNPEVLERKIAETTTRIRRLEDKMRRKKEPKAVVAFGSTSIPHYLDPRITVAWCMRHEVLPVKVLSKRRFDMYPWALEVDPDFRY